MHYIMTFFLFQWLLPFICSFKWHVHSWRYPTGGREFTSDWEAGGVCGGEVGDSVQRPVG